MADRSHNVEDLYNMSIEKLHIYVKETRNYIYPLSTYAKEHYPELSNGVTILKSKIVSLTELTETLVCQYDDILAKKNKEVNDPPPTLTLRGVGFVPLARTQGEHDTRYPVDREYLKFFGNAGPYPAYSSYMIQWCL